LINAFRQSPRRRRHLKRVCPAAAARSRSSKLRRRLVRRLFDRARSLLPPFFAFARPAAAAAAAATGSAPRRPRAARARTIAAARR